MRNHLNKNIRAIHIFLFILFCIHYLSSQKVKGTDLPSLSYHTSSLSESQTLPQLSWVLEEGSLGLNIDDIVKGDFKDSKIITLEKNPFFTIKAHKPYWFNLQLSSDIALDSVGLVLGLNGNGWPWEFTFKNVEAHIYNQGKKIRTGLSGTAIPYSKRDEPQKINPSVIWLNFHEKDTLDIWFSAEMAESNISEILMDLAPHYKIKQTQSATFKANMHSALNGAGIALLLIALALFTWFREPIYLWFILFQIILLLHNFTFIFNNETYLFLFKENPRALVIGSTFISMCMILTLLQFGRIYIGTKEKFPKIDRIIKMLLILLVFTSIPGILLRMIPSDLGTYWFSIRPIPMGTFFIGMISVLVFFMFQKDKFARVYGLGVGFYAMIILSSLVLVNISDNLGYLVSKYTYLINHFSQIFTTTVILAFRFVLMTQEKRKANKEKLNAELEKLKQQQLAEQKTKEAERLEELDKIKSNFFSNITHEFRTPLTLIIEPLRQVIEQPDKPWRNKVELAKNNSQKLLELINQLLDISKLENKQMNLELKRSNILEVIRPLVESFKLLAKKKGINLSFEHPASISLFDFDKDKMEKIASNLMSNAMKFTEKDGQIKIQIQEKNQNGYPYFNFKINDTGLGISEEQQIHVFDRFYQVDGSNTRRHQGTGIGLSLCKELVELMNGTIHLESQLGKGSTFSISIPMRFEREKEIIQQNILPIKTTPHHQKTFENINIDLEANNLALVIEDNDELRQFIVSSINEKYQVIEARNGKEGLEKALEFIPNIIVSDVMMPEMNGFEVCKKIKTDEKTAHIPVILLTAKTAMDSKIQGLEYGADAYINKPFNTKELFIRMKNLIDIRVFLQQKFSQEVEDVSKESRLSDPIISDFDKQFLSKLKEFVRQQLGEEDLSVEDIAQQMAMSRTQLFRKLKALLNQSPSEFLRNIRLKTAKQLLEEKKGNISEIAYRVGFSSQKYFSTKFKEKYGIRPSEI